jgi:lipopolysaccharide transport system permease protein
VVESSREQGPMSRPVAGRKGSASASWIRRVPPASIVVDLYSHRDLIRQFAWRDVASRYRGSYLGMAWSFVTPLLMLVVYAFVFSVVFKSRWATDSAPRIDFALILFCGLTTFNVFSECVSRASGLVLGNPSYVKKVVFPLQTLNVSVLLSSLVNLGVGLVILLVGWLFVHHTVSTTIWTFPLVLIPLCSLSLGLSWFFSALGVFVRDLAQPVMILVSALFFMSGIFFPIEAVPAKVQVIMRLNPLTSILEDSRRTLLWSQYPQWKWWAITTAFSLVFMVLGYLWFQRTKHAFADVI